MTAIPGRCTRGACWSTARTALTLFLGALALIYLFGGMRP